MNLTDRHLTESLINLVGALAYKLTGERPMLCLEDDDGNLTHFIPDVNRVTWLKDGAERECPFHDARYFSEDHAAYRESLRDAKEEADPVTAPAA